METLNGCAVFGLDVLARNVGIASIPRTRFRDDIPRWNDPWVPKPIGGRDDALVWHRDVRDACMRRRAFWFILAGPQKTMLRCCLSVIDEARATCIVNNQSAELYY